MDRLINKTPTIMLINKPWWEIKHLWICEDLKYEEEEIEEFLLFLRKHPDPEDRLRPGYLSIIKQLTKQFKDTKKKYKEIYGVYPKKSVYMTHAA